VKGIYTHPSGLGGTTLRREFNVFVCYPTSGNANINLAKLDDTGKFISNSISSSSGTITNLISTNSLLINSPALSGNPYIASINPNASKIQS